MLTILSEAALAMLPSAAAMIQPDKSPDLVCYACTSGSILNGEQNCMDAIKVGATFKVDDISNWRC